MKRAQYLQQSDVEDRHWWHRGKRVILRKVFNAVIPPGENRLLIDVGCGTGGNMGDLSRDYVCVGLDASADALDLARARFPGARFIHGAAPADLGDLAPKAEGFLMADVVEHVEDDRAFMAAWAAAARPGAFFVVTVPALRSLWSAHDVSLGHFRRYEAADFPRLWEGLDLRPRLVAFYNRRLYPAVACLRALGRAMGKTWGGAGTDVGMTWAPLNALLGRIFSGEAAPLCRDLAEGRREPRGRGVSLMAVLQKNG